MDERDPSASTVAEIQKKLKATLKRRYESQIEGISVTPEFYGPGDIEICVVKGEYDEVIWQQHDVTQIETVRYRPELSKTLIRTLAIRQLFDGFDKYKVLLTHGVAGIGKTRAVQRYILDWAEGKENQELDFLFPLPCRELNILFGKKTSLDGLLYEFFPELQEPGLPNLENYKVLFIFDGLDELYSREDIGGPLHFEGGPNVSDVTEVCLVDDLMTNLIMKSLLPSAHIWLTCRPTYDCFPDECINKMTELRGFNDSQKEEFFRKTVNNDHLADRVITHVKSCGSLYVTCQIPSICSITASVLKKLFEDPKLISRQIPKTLTQVYTTLISNHTKDRRHAETARKIGRLEKLAMHQLMRNSVTVYESDLKRVDMDVSEASEYTKMFSDIFREDIGLHNKKMFYFVHNTMEEYLAATHLFHARVKNDGNKPFDQKLYLSDILKTIEDKRVIRGMMECALESKKGNLDLFLHFLLGTSRDFTLVIQSLVPLVLPDLLGTVVELIKEKALQKILTSKHRAVNLLRCLKEMKDETLDRDIKCFLETANPPDPDFTHAQWSALAFEWLSLEGAHDVFEMDLESRSDQGVLGLLPMIKASKTALLHFCNLTDRCCKPLTSVITSDTGYLTELDLGFNTIRDTGMKELCLGLGTKQCRLVKLNLTGCGVTKAGCEYLSEALDKNFHLKELDLSSNELEDYGIFLIALGMAYRRKRLNVIKFSQCAAREKCCGTLATTMIQTVCCDLCTDLDLSMNDLGDQGVNTLTSTLMLVDLGPLLTYQCCLSLYYCNLTEGCCKQMGAFLGAVSGPTRLNLSSNKLLDSGVMLLCEGLRSKLCYLQKLNLANCGITEEGCAALASALDSNPSLSESLRELDLSRNQLTDSGVNQLAAALKNPCCVIDTLRLSYCDLTERCCAALASALGTDHSPLTELDLCGNELRDQGVKMLCIALRLPRCNMKTLSLRCCGIKEDGFSTLSRTLRTNPKHMTELNLMGNDPGQSGVSLLVDILDDPYFNLTTSDIVVEADRDKLKPHHLSKLAW